MAAKKMRLGIIGLAWLLVALLPNALPSVVSADGLLGATSTSPGSGPAGTVITAVVTGAPPGDRVSFSNDFGDGVNAPYHAVEAYGVVDASGNCTISITVPSDAPLGTWSGGIFDVDRGEIIDFTAFTVTASGATSAPAPSPGTPGNVRVTGYTRGFDIIMIWSPSPGAVSGYRVYWGITSTFGPGLRSATTPASAQSYEFSVLDDIKGTGIPPVCFWLTAFNQAGESAPASGGCLSNNDYIPG